jgi:hypothetical protein
MMPTNPLVNIKKYEWHFHIEKKSEGSDEYGDRLVRLGEGYLVIT